jgi:hypothetical protein
MPTRTERTYQVTQIEMLLETSHANFTRAFESLLGRMPVEAFGDLPSLSPEAARERLASFVEPLDFSLFQRIDHGSIVTAFTGRRCGATTYVFGNALIAIEMTKHVARAGLYVPLRLFVEAMVGSERMHVIAHTFRTRSPLLRERRLQVAQHTELGEHDGSGVVAVERAHLPILNMEDIDARDVEFLTGSGKRSKAHGKVTSMGSVQRQLNDDDVTVEVQVGEFAVHVRKCSRVDVGRTSDFVAAVLDAGRDVPPIAVRGEQRAKPLGFLLCDRVQIADNLFV